MYKYFRAIFCVYMSTFACNLDTIISFFTLWKFRYFILFLFHFYVQLTSYLPLIVYSFSIYFTFFAPAYFFCLLSRFQHRIFSKNHPFKIYCDCCPPQKRFPSILISRKAVDIKVLLESYRPSANKNPIIFSLLQPISFFLRFRPHFQILPSSYYHIIPTNPLAYNRSRGLSPL